jgi:hypothetical protein
MQVAAGIAALVEALQSDHSDGSLVVFTAAVEAAGIASVLWTVSDPSPGS